MYLVTIYDGPNDTQGTVIHTPYTDPTKVSNGVVNLVIQGISNFKFTINPSNPAWGKIDPLRTLVKVVDAKRNKTIFDGRVLQPSQKMSSNGQFSISYECEDKLAYLHDSSQRHGEYRNMTIRDFFTVMINNHNRQVEPHKQFKVGNVTVTNATDNVYRYLGYGKTFDEIKDKLIDRLGGFLRIREEPIGTYIDYLESVGEVKETPIRLRTNLKDMQKDIDPTEIITRLVPLGARIESEDEDTVDASEARLTITNVNGGKDYIDDLALQAEFGIIEGSMTWDDVNTESTLLLRGNQFMQAQKAARISYSITPVNVDLIDTSFEAFEVGNWHNIINPVLAIDEPLQIIGQQIDILNPQLANLTIGEKYRTLSQYQVESNKQMLTIQNLEGQVDRLGRSNSHLRVAYEAIHTEIENVQQDLINVDLDDLPAELQSLHTQLEAIQTAIGNLPIVDLTPLETELASLTARVEALEQYVPTINDLVTRVEALENDSEPPTEPEESE